MEAELQASAGDIAASVERAKTQLSERKQEHEQLVAAIATGGKGLAESKTEAVQTMRDMIDSEDQIAEFAKKLDRIHEAKGVLEDGMDTKALKSFAQKCRDVQDQYDRLDKAVEAVKEADQFLLYLTDHSGDDNAIVLGFRFLKLKEELHIATQANAELKTDLQAELAEFKKNTAQEMADLKQQLADDAKSAAEISKQQSEAKLKEVQEMMEWYRGKLKEEQQAKARQAVGSPSGNLFGSTPGPHPPGSIFGAGSASPSSGGSPGLFGAAIPLPNSGSNSGGGGSLFGTPGPHPPGWD